MIISYQKKLAESRKGFVLTRNRYGAVIANFSNILCLDVDIKAKPRFSKWLLLEKQRGREDILTVSNLVNNRKIRGMRPRGSRERQQTAWVKFFKKFPELEEDYFSAWREWSELKRDGRDLIYAKLRGYLDSLGLPFRTYKTTAGYRAVCVGRRFSPESREAIQIMEESGTDKRYIDFCKIQKSFRVRLTPKPWRIESSSPPKYPRRTEESKVEFEEWLKEYKEKSSRYSVCKFIEEIGGDKGIDPEITPYIEYHDRFTKCFHGLPLEPR